MDSILVVCASRETAEGGLRMAAGLSVACGARLSLVYAHEWAGTVTPTAGLEAVGHLSNVLFSPRDGPSPAPAFEPCQERNWLAAMRARVGDYCETAPPQALPSLVRERQPDLVVTCDGGLARMLVGDTGVPVWHVHSRHLERAWFSMRTLRCAVRGSRAAEWAGTFAKGLGAELETMRAGFFRPANADLVVVDRESQASFMSVRAVQPIVIV